MSQPAPPLGPVDVCPPHAPAATWPVSASEPRDLYGCWGPGCVHPETQCPVKASVAGAGQQPQGCSPSQLAPSTATDVRRGSGKPRARGWGWPSGCLGRQLPHPHRCSTWPTCSSSLPTPLGQTCGCWSGPRTSAAPTSPGSSSPVSVPEPGAGRGDPGAAVSTELSGARLPHGSGLRVHEGGCVPDVGHG